ncbi:T9SS C-terminal target domain-containing protein [Flavobacterium circumlabens]|uniref:Repeat protein (TIGR01451 family)/predicted secreted protein (Por secretion system target) n=1 Tax=Flavobacterium circumlabens TaxID=2133765 RepID=A0A4Y7UB99_9FLAO|nr:T9SS type A sorting domain-containing protein [Flavobacterium circumlabens]TCN55544.1 putative repeat protein (TIGR01451 family)/predicted secreted protein (Por secretion system target) [Flavobacterium circumlabens]TEB43052.1 T9SS C-terminal target domain-containing protein [Flavobacterium circumlabens]
MKKLYFLTFVLFLYATSQAQTIYFPDVTFKYKLLESNNNSYIALNQNGEKINIDINGDGEIQIAEALNVYEINVNFFNISSIKGVENFKNLRILQCIGNSLTEVDLPGLKNLKEFYCSGNKISNLNIEGLENLETLDCYDNLLNELDFRVLKKLKSLKCSGSNVQKLNVTGLTNLEYIFCDNSQLTELNVSGALNLKYLKIDFNNLVSVNVSGCINLETFVCDNNKLTNLNLDGLVNLRTLLCNENQLTDISVKGLVNLINFKCVNNKFKSLDLTPLKGLVYLYCGFNNLEKLDLTGLSKLLFIHCENNQLTNLDLSGVEYIYDLFCGNNQLIYLNLKNGSPDSQLIFGNNPDLKFICVDDSQIDSITQMLSYSGFTNCVVNSYCSFTPGGTFYTIKGNSKFDGNKNGCDTDDIFFPNLNFNITNGTLKGNIISDESGNYSIPVGEGTQTITPILENPDYFEVLPTSATTTFPIETSPFTQNFCVTPKGEHQDVEISILSILPARPGFDTSYKLVFKNKGNQITSGSVTFDFNDSVLDFVSASPLVSSQDTNKLVWNYENLQPFQTREISVTLNVNSPMETPAVNINDRLSFNALITPVTGDEKPVDNSFAMRQTVVGSYDPNDKTCLEGDVITPELIGEYVHYQIRFENTGTYPAENIVAKDMIDLSKFDISTLVPISASHSYTTKISEGNRVEFIFEKINLPFDDAHNDGYIAFKIKTLPTLKTGDSFTNEANIYFDYNFPILTNKATSTFKTLGTQDFEFSKYFNIYPNPVKDVLNIISIKNDATIKSIAVYDVLGQLVIAVPNAADVSTIDVSKLRTGNYFLKIKTDKGTSSSKFIKF